MEKRRGRGELEKRERSGSRAAERDCPSMVPSGICSAMQGRKRRRLICGVGMEGNPTIKYECTSRLGECDGDLLASLLGGRSISVETCLSASEEWRADVRIEAYGRGEVSSDVRKVEMRLKN